MITSPGAIMQYRIFSLPNLIGVDLTCGPGIVKHHSEEAAKIVCPLAINFRPTKNLSFPQARFVFFTVPSPIIIVGLGPKIQVCFYDQPDGGWEYGFIFIWASQTLVYFFDPFVKKIEGKERCWMAGGGLIFLIRFCKSDHPCNHI